MITYSNRAHFAKVLDYRLQEGVHRKGRCKVHHEFTVQDDDGAHGLLMEMFKNKRFVA